MYPKSAIRTRGDTDILFTLTTKRARAVLTSLGLSRGNDDPPSPFDLQEEWHLRNDKGPKQSLDLHWQVLNSPALSSALPLSDCFKEKLALPEIGAAALAMRRPLTLIHTCLHRAMHIQSPYFVGKQTYHGGDRLIWLVDIEILSTRMSAADWHEFASTAREQHLAEVCRSALEAARKALDVPLPQWLLTELRE